MAFFQVNFFSEILCFHTDVNVFIPTPDSSETLCEETCSWFQRGSRFQVMYLLHGTYGDYTDWLRLTGVERYAKQHRMALVMPSASNSFYHDMKAGSDYLSYLTRELPAFITKYFPISERREDTFIAGLSMGGYGAMKAALEYPEKYAACASLSGVLDVQEFQDHIYKYLPENPYFWDCIFEALNAKGLTSGDIGIINVNASTQTAVDREAGFREAFEGSGFNILETQYCDGDASKAQSFAENYITQGVVGIYGTNEGSSTGVGNAIKASGDTEILGVGFDKSDTIKGLIRDGYLLCTMAQNPDVMGSEGVKACVKALNGEDLGGAVMDTGVSVITKDNVDQF